MAPWRFCLRTQPVLYLQHQLVGGPEPVINGIAGRVAAGSCGRNQAGSGRPTPKARSQRRGPARAAMLREPGGLVLAEGRLFLSDQGCAALPGRAVVGVWIM